MSVTDREKSTCFTCARKQPNPLTVTVDWQWAGPGINIDIYIVLRRSTKTVIAKCLRVLSLGSRCQNSDYFAYFLVTDEKVLPLFRSPRMITLANGSCSRQNLSTLSVRQVAIAVTQIHFATLGTLPCIVFFTFIFYDIGRTLTRIVLVGVLVQRDLSS